jgi:hypothetical protein
MGARCASGCVRDNNSLQFCESRFLSLRLNNNKCKAADEGAGQLRHRGHGGDRARLSPAARGSDLTAGSPKRIGEETILLQLSDFACAFV